MLANEFADMQNRRALFANFVRKFRKDPTAATGVKRLTQRKLCCYMRRSFALRLDCTTGLADGMPMKTPFVWNAQMIAQ